ncbi:hypothetical protein DRP04_11040 [Archaeoglobales archaeon]|nr:MAG: hypothetical protein DRP04_11040 [Archaeoglobales archaeon]
MVEKVIRNLEPKGTGKPDYWRNIKVLERANTIKRIALLPNENLKMFQRTFSETPSPFVWVTSPLEPGAEANLIDASTGQEMPYTVPAGYELEVLMIWASMDQKVRMAMDLLGYLVGEYYLDAYTIYYESEVKEMSTKDIDPTFSMEIPIRFYGVNLGTEAAHGYAKVVCILRKHGTPEIKTKVVKCKWCGYEQEVEKDITKWNCPKCGKLNLFWVFK